MDKALPQIGIDQCTCLACGATLREGPLEKTLAHCRGQFHLQRFVRSPLFTNGDEIVPCDIDRRFQVVGDLCTHTHQSPLGRFCKQHLCVLCCCGVETGKFAEHLASAGHAGQRVLACLPLATAAPAMPQPLAPSSGDQIKRVQCATTTYAPGVTATTIAPIPAPLVEGTPPASGDLYWVRLPPELRQTIVETSSCPLHAYIQLLGLSHAIRQSFRGTLRELSFPDPDPALADMTPIITVDAFAALVGPCKSLNKLVIPEGWTDFDGAKHIDWVDETFGGHNQLAVLALPSSLSEPDVERILSHLPSLLELTVNPRLIMNLSMLAALARSCSDLQVLRCSIDTVYQRSGGSLAAILGSLSALTSLKLFLRCPPAPLESIASHLTSLELSHILCKEDLPGPWLCRLETLTLDLSHNTADLVLASLFQLLTANRSTLHSLSLRLLNAEAPPLVASLRSLPHLTRLALVVMSPGCTLSALPPDLVERLECLHIELGAIEPAPVRIASSRLQKLHLSVYMGPASGLALRCPALVELEVARCRLLSLECPRLRTIQATVESLDGAAPMPMPDLEVAVFSGWQPLEDPAWLLTGESPRLRVLSGVRLNRPDLLARLCACGSLVRLEALYLNTTRLPNPLVLRLSGQLEYLGLHIERANRICGRSSPLGLQVESPGLLFFDLTITDKSLPSVRMRLQNCPHLVRLALKSQAVLSLQVDEDGKGMPMQPRSLLANGLDAASLLGLLTRHGDRLQRLSAAQLQAMRFCWPQLMGALSGLPRLTSLTIDVDGAPSPLSFVCPQLRTLDVRVLEDETKVVLACPLLEELVGIRDPTRQLELALPAPNLRLSG
ncbi:hypothetical protein PAPYR_4688 [Paratrimastix pyriformis]|uniref:C2H2-type domain-containing protein n=1 Tax=Paratrimastix pyriformis TaxID=342808 RepID=A0ABQ8UKP5_9EUKA|nr:hypothetical protein PAPYR_4688 [Paratrimastix pyriformis]